jgi:hypothetical protein
MRRVAHKGEVRNVTKYWPENLKARGHLWGRCIGNGVQGLLQKYVVNTGKGAEFTVQLV